MKKLMIASFLSILTLLLMNCATTKITPGENVDPASIELVYKTMIQWSGQGVIAPPALSPDRTRKLSASMGGGKLYVEDIKGSEKQNVYTAASDGVFSPHIADISWSPDGQRAAIFVIWGMSNAAQYTLLEMENFNSSSLLGFTPPFAPGRKDQGKNDVVYNCGASWKNERILVMSAFLKNSEQYHLLEYDIGSGEKTIISESDVIKAFFSPDGGKAAFFRPGGQYEGNWYSSLSSLESYFKTLDLYIGDADFSNAEKIADGIIINRRVTWSEDGRYLAYVQDGKRTLTGAKNTLKILDTHKNDSYEICTGTFLNSPRFYPGNEIYFFVGDNIYKTKI